MEEQVYEPRKVMRWAIENPKEWEIVCGIRNTSVEANRKIAGMLKEAELFELLEMMTMRSYQMILDTWEAEGEGDLII